MRDLHNNITVKRLIDPVDHGTGNTATVSQIIDRQDADALELIFAVGSVADADTVVTVLVEDGNDSALADNAAVDDSNLLGTEIGSQFQFDSDNTVHKIGYIGNKRYVRVTLTPANNTGAMLISGTAVLWRLRSAPDSTQSGS